MKILTNNIIDGVLFSKPWLNYDNDNYEIESITIEGNNNITFKLSRFNDYGRFISKEEKVLPKDIDFFILDDTFDKEDILHCNIETKKCGLRTVLKKNRLIPNNNSLFFYKGGIFKIVRKCWFKNTRYYAAMRIDKAFFSGYNSLDMKMRNEHITYWFHSRNEDLESIIKIENEESETFKELKKLMFYLSTRLSK